MTPYYQDEAVTLYHGDCRDVLPTLTESVDLLLTDPPYGVEFKSNYRQGDGFDHIIGDDEISTEWIAPAVALMADGAAAYVFTRWDVMALWADAVSDHLHLKDVIVWHKPGGGLGDTEGGWLPNHEEVIYAVKGKHILRGTRASNVWSINKDYGGAYRHPTQKPLGVMSRPIEASTDPGQLILDPFVGSGSSLVAAKQIGRRAIGIEIDEAYCEVIVSRLAQGVMFSQVS